MYATDYSGDLTTSSKRCINKNANGPKILVPQASLVNSTTKTVSYSAFEGGQVSKQTRNKNLREPNVLNLSVTTKTMPITPKTKDGVLNNTEQELNSDFTSSHRYRYVNKNANGPKYRGLRGTLTNSMTPTYSYSALESGQVVQRTRNKNLRGPKFLNTSDTATTTPIAPIKNSCVPIDTEQIEIKASDNIVRTGINKNMRHVVNNSNLPLKQTQGNIESNDNCLLQVNTEALSTITPLIDAPVTATIDKTAQAVNIGAKPTKLNVPTGRSLAHLYLENVCVNRNTKQVESTDVNVNNIQVKPSLHISVAARPGHFYSTVEYDRPLYCC